MSVTTERSHAAAKQRKATSIEIRLAAHTKARSLSAARPRHTSVSEFVLSSAVREAQNALADQRVFQVSDQNWSRFMAILGAPAKADPDIVALARSKAPWDR